MKVILVITLAFLSACSRNVSSELSKPNQGELAEQIPPSMRAKERSRIKDSESVILPGGGGFINKDAAAKIENTQIGEGALPPLPNADDLIWTDPDNPDQNLGNVETAFTKPVKDPWQLSYQAAQRLSFAEGKPIMIWFTDSKRSPICKMLGRDLFGKKSFEEWSEQKVIKLRVDLSPPESDSEKYNLKREYAAALRKKFRVKGSPTVLVIGNSGETLGRYTGYKSGSSEYYWGRIKNAASTAEEGYFDWKVVMEKKGYRNWEGANGVKLFAKPLKYKDSNLLVVEPSGRKTTFKESNLSLKDQEWVEAQKNKS